MYGFTNDAGEPIMSGEAYRFEQQLDADSAAERFDDDYYDQQDIDDLADYMEADDEDTEPWEAEDGWLDGSYEE